MAKNDKLIFNEFKPGKEFENIVDSYWEFIYCYNLDSFSNPSVFPNTSTLLIYFRDNVSNTSDLLITGPCAKSVKVPHSTDCYYFAVEFKPLIFKSLFDFKTSLTVDKIVYASEIIGEDNKETLLHQLSGSKSGKSIQQVFEEFFKSYLIKSITFDIDVFKAIELLNKTNGKEKIENIYKKVSIGKRQFQRNFLTETGITLKEFARIIRVRAAADEVVKGTADPSDIIYDFGFYDQSHYYKEFKIFSGVNPTIFAERQKKLTRQSR